MNKGGNKISPAHGENHNADRQKNHESLEHGIDTLAPLRTCCAQCIQVRAEKLAEYADEDITDHQSCNCLTAKAAIHAQVRVLSEHAYRGQHKDPGLPHNTVNQDLARVYGRGEEQVYICHGKERHPLLQPL